MCNQEKSVFDLVNAENYKRLMFGVAAPIERRPHTRGATTASALPPGFRHVPGASKSRPWECYVPERSSLHSGDVEVVDGVLVCCAHSTQDGRRVGCREYEELLIVSVA